MRHWAMMIFPLLLAACGGGGSMPVDREPLGPGVPTPGLETPSAHAGFALLLNQERDGAGVRSVQEDSRLSAAARAHAQDMVTNKYFAHTDLNGGNVGDRARAVGYNYNYISENIAHGQRSNAEVVRDWMNSPNHKVNMVDERAEDFGLGRVNNMWVLVLGREHP